MDYKTARHHIAVLIEYGLVTRSVGERQGELYSLSPLMRDNLDSFDKIWARIGRREKRGRKR